MISIPVALGELVDKITILEIKLERIRDPEKQESIRKELKLLRGITDKGSEFSLELKRINAVIWDAEEAVRACEKAGDFGPFFIDAARSIYWHNDRRAAVKRQINLLFESALVEEKSY